MTANPPPEPRPDETELSFVATNYMTNPGFFELWSDSLLKPIESRLAGKLPGAEYTLAPPNPRTSSESAHPNTARPYYRVPSLFLVVLSALIAAALLTVPGILIALFSGLLPVYLTYRVPYLIALVTAIILATARYGELRIHDAYNELRPCFLVSDKEYLDRIAHWYRHIASISATLAVSGVLAVAGTPLVALGFLNSHFIELLRGLAIRPGYPYNWYLHNISLGKFFLALYGWYVVAFFWGPVAWILTANFRFLVDLGRRFSVVPAPNIIRLRMRKTADYYLGITLAYALAVVVIGILFVDRINPASILILIFTSILGLLTFLTPQFIFRRYLMVSYRVVCDWALIALGRQLRVTMFPQDDWRVYGKAAGDIQRLEQMDKILAVTDRPSMSVYDSEDFLVIFLAQLSAVGLVLLEVHLR